MGGGGGAHIELNPPDEVAVMVMQASNLATYLTLTRYLSHELSCRQTLITTSMLLNVYLFESSDKSPYWTNPYHIGLRYEASLNFHAYFGQFITTGVLLVHCFRVRHEIFSFHIYKILGVEINSLSHSRAASNYGQQTTWSQQYVITETSRTCLCIFLVSGYNKQYFEQRIEWQAICDTMKLTSHHYNE